MVGPETQAVVVRAANLVQLQARVLLAVVVLSNGSVQKEVVYLDDDVSEDDVAVASTRLAEHLDGRRLVELVTALPDARGADRADVARCVPRRRRFARMSSSTRANCSTSGASAASPRSTTRS